MASYAKDSKEDNAKDDEEEDAEDNEDEEEEEEEDNISEDERKRIKNQRWALVLVQASVNCPKIWMTFYRETCLLYVEH